ELALRRSIDAAPLRGSRRSLCSVEILIVPRHQSEEEGTCGRVASLTEENARKAQCCIARSRFPIEGASVFTLRFREPFCPRQGLREKYSRAQRLESPIYSL